jgi:hypothetical protein
MGPVRGMTVHSYRAEASGVLAFLRFLIHIARFTQMHDTWRGVLATDSQSLLDTLFGRDHREQENTGPVDLDQNRVVLDVMCPEWDILIEIQKSLQLLSRVCLEYIEGHQDKKTSYHNLCLLAQLNVDADQIAGHYHELSSSHSPFAILSPNTRAHVLFEMGTVTSRYDENIRMWAVKHQWTEATMEKINWISHGQALKRNTHRRSHLIKFLYNILPTTGMLNKFDGGQRTCPLCEAKRIEIISFVAHTRLEQHGEPES